ncbi:MAG: glycosyltransferase family 4 protein [Halodesulfurarchaeum sp.]|nr:glycosyltransferase family 4 protein [Halodesulfurarchaeum sp.]
MKALYITEESISFSDSMVRGGQIHVRNVVKGLRNRGHDIHLLDWNTTDDDFPFHHSLKPQFRVAIDPLRTVLQARNLAKSIEANVIISKTRKTYVPGKTVARLLNIPHVIQVGSSPKSVNKSNFLNRIETESIIRRLRFGHDGYFAVSESIANDLGEIGVPKERIFNIKNAVNTNQFHPEGAPVNLDEYYRRQIKPFVKNKFVLGYIGGLYPYKGLTDLASALERTDSDPVVVIAGDGPERDNLKKEFAGRALFLGAVPYEQVPALYHQFDVFVLPSYTEGLPRVVLEAQAAGKAVVATRVGGIPEIVSDGETGRLIDPGQPENLAETLDHLASNEAKRRHLGDNGRAAIEDEFTWEKLYDRYERYLDRILRTHEGSRSGQK